MVIDDKLPEEVQKYLRRLGSYGKLGGTARAENLTPAQRKASAKKAAEARWADLKKKAGKKGKKKEETG